MIKTSKQGQLLYSYSVIIIIFIIVIIIIIIPMALVEPQSGTHFVSIVWDFTIVWLCCVRIKNNPRWHISSSFRGRQGRLPESGRRIPGCFQIVSKRYMGTE